MSTYTGMKTVAKPLRSPRTLRLHYYKLLRTQRTRRGGGDNTSVRVLADSLRPPRSLRLYSVDKQQRMPDAVALFARGLAHLTK